MNTDLNGEQIDFYQENGFIILHDFLAPDELETWIYPQWKEIMPVPAQMKAGSCSFHNGLIGHGAGPNMTPGWRRAMTCGYMPDGSTFNGNQNILTKEWLETLTVGYVLDDDSQNPLLYHNAKPYMVR